MKQRRASFYSFLWLIKLFDRRSFYLKPLKVAPLTKLVRHGNDPNLSGGIHTLPFNKQYMYVCFKNSLKDSFYTFLRENSVETSLVNFYLP